jgi:microsomal epoxide hydrolase
MGRPEGILDDSLEASERDGIKRMEEFRMMGSGYAIEHGTRPSTIGHVLASNPVALLAW